MQPGAAAIRGNKAVGTRSLAKASNHLGNRMCHIVISRPPKEWKSTSHGQVPSIRSFNSEFVTCNLNSRSETAVNIEIGDVCDADLGRGKCIGHDALNRG